jgi:RNA polymerase sigma-70 factor (ECF subfamily)
LKPAKLTDSDRFIPTRQSLLSRLKDWNDQESWRLFFDTYWGLIYKAAVRAGLTAAEAEDVVQETVVSVSKSLPGFDYQEMKGGFKGWLMRLTTWRILDQIRKRTPEVAVLEQNPDDTSVESAPIEQMTELTGHPFETLWDQEWESNLLEAAMRRVKASVDPKQFQIFDLLVRKDWPAAKVSADLQINVARVYLAKHRVGRLLKKEIECLRTKPM